MDTVREIALSVSVSATVIGAVYIICPSGQMSRFMKYILGLILLLCIVTPFMSASFNFEKLEARADYSAQAEEMLINQTQHIVAAVLSENGISYEKIEVYMDISEDGSISIYRIHLFGVSDNKAAELLRQSINGCEVVIEDG